MKGSIKNVESLKWHLSTDNDKLKITAYFKDIPIARIIEKNVNDYDINYIINLSKKPEDIYSHHISLQDAKNEIETRVNKTLKNEAFFNSLLVYASELRRYGRLAQKRADKERKKIYLVLENYKLKYYTHKDLTNKGILQLMTIPDLCIIVDVFYPDWINLHLNRKVFIKPSKIGKEWLANQQ